MNNGNSVKIINPYDVEGIDSEIYELCKTCEHNVSDEAFKTMHDPNYEYEIIWGNVYLKEKFK